MIPAKWRDAVASIADPRKWPIEWIEGEIAAGRIGLMESQTAIIGVERREYPGGFVELHGLFAAGDLDGVLALIDHAVVIAKEQGFDAATIASKPAWGRILKSRGFLPDQLTVTKELHDGA